MPANKKSRCYGYSWAYGFLFIYPVRHKKVQLWGWNLPHDRLMNQRRGKIRSNFFFFQLQQSLPQYVLHLPEINQDDFQELEKCVHGLFWQKGPHSLWSGENNSNPSKWKLCVAQGGLKLGRIYAKFLFFQAISFSHNELSDLLTKYEKCLF